MTKKDFEAIATALRDQRDAMLASFMDTNKQQATIERIHASTCRTIATVCAKQNPKFRRDLFLTACGIRS